MLGQFVRDISLPVIDWMIANEQLVYGAALIIVALGLLVLLN